VSRAQNKEKILNGTREKCQVSYKGKLLRIKTDLSTEILKARRAWMDVF
jgi:hypothetical protein